MSKLSEDQMSFLKLVQRSIERKSTDGEWAPVSDALLAFAEAQQRTVPELVDLDRDARLIRLTHVGKIVLKYI